MDVVEAFSRNVKAARADAGLTQDEVAAAASMDVGQYRKIENGQTNVSIRTVARIAGALGLVGVDGLLTGAEPDAALRGRRR